MAPSKASKATVAAKAAHDEVVLEILKLLPSLGRALGRTVPPDIRREGISVAQVKALVHLAQHGAQTMSDLATGLRITTPSATGLINPLVEQGYVVRHRESKDRRVVTVSLSEEAEPLADRLVNMRKGQIAKVIEDFTPEEQALFLSGLRKLAAVFGGEPLVETY
ncbi:MAG: MarR family transcriptional regulator [Actinobacteria bacterium]|nr:MarR family transcriptional regulator [Actinomycetota bacterium]